MLDIVKYNSEKHIIDVKSVGDLTPQILNQSLSDINNAYNEFKCNKVYVDAYGVTSFLMPASAFNFGAELARLLSECSFAIFTSQNTVKDMAYFEKVANARGGNVKLFLDKVETMAWLLKQH